MVEKQHRHKKGIAKSLLRCAKGRPVEMILSSIFSFFKKDSINSPLILNYTYDLTFLLIFLTHSIWRMVRSFFYIIAAVFPQNDLIKFYTIELFWLIFVYNNQGDESEDWGMK